MVHNCKQIKLVQSYRQFIKAPCTALRLMVALAIGTMPAAAIQPATILNVKSLLSRMAMQGLPFPAGLQRLRRFSRFSQMAATLLSVIHYTAEQIGCSISILLNMA